MEFLKGMSPAFQAYTLCWQILLFAAIYFLIRTRDQHVLFRKPYWLFLSRPWKLFTFAISAGPLILMGPYTIDPTWDYIDAGFMSLLTFTTAPWAIGVIYRAFRKRETPGSALAALCLWLFSASWSYDFYLFLKEGHYPVTWWANLVLSSILYFSAGILWNLDWIQGKGIILAFEQSDWPNTYSAKVFWKIFWIALPFMLIATWLTLGFIKRG